MKFHLALAVALYSTTLLANPPTVDKFSESLNNKVKVSGRFHAGLLIKTNAVSDKLYVLMPETPVRQLCVDITSIDGVYKADIVYDLEDTSQGYLELPFPTQYKEQLVQYQPMELAVKARIGEDCKIPDNRHVLASWGKNSDSHSLLLLIRSDARRDVAYIPDIENAIQKVKCRKFNTAYNVAYDKYCLFENIDLNTVGSIEVERKNFRKLPSEKFELK